MEQKKKCLKCKKKKSISKFGKNRSMKDGLNSWCLECFRTYTRDYQWRTRYKKVFEKYKFKCAKCGSKKKLEIHHINKKSDNRLESLILVCSKCHLTHCHGGVFTKKNKVCIRCSHTWESRVENPKVCPKCKSPYWNTKRRNKK